MYSRRYLSAKNGVFFKIQEFYSLEEMNSAPLPDFDIDESENMIVGEFDEKNNLIRYYAYKKRNKALKTSILSKLFHGKSINPSNSAKILTIDLNNGIITYDNGITVSAVKNNLLRSMEIAVIRPEDVPALVVNRVNSLFTPSNWYNDGKQQEVIDTVACDIHYETEMKYKLILDIFFGFNVSDERRYDSYLWKFNSIFMYSTISKNKRTFGRNSFRNHDLERLVKNTGFAKNKDLIDTINSGDDIAIAKMFELKPCDYKNIFSLCNARHQGISI
jgi:hypothetical protein